MSATGRGPEERHRVGDSESSGTANNRLTHGAISAPVDIAGPTEVGSE